MNPTPTGWAMTTIGSVFKTVGGGTPDTGSPGFWDGDIPWVTSADLGADGSMRRRRTVSMAGIESSAANLVPPNTVVVATRVGLGKVAIAPTEMAFSQDCQGLLPVPDVADEKFTFYQIGYRANLLRAASRGTTISGVPKAALLRLPFSLPPLPEQRLIVGAIEEQFSRIDAARRLLHATRQGLGRFRSSVLATITPPDGTWTTLGEIAEIVGGVTKDSKRQQDPSFVEVPYLRVANVQRGYLDLGDVTTIRVSRDKATSLRLKPGDVLFNEGGDRDKLGRGWVWQGELDECIHQNHVFRARLLDDRFDPKFVSMHGNTFGQPWFERMGKQSTNLASINLKTLKGFPIPELPLEDQRKIVAEAERQLTLAESCAKGVEHALIRSENLRSAVLASAFSGRLSS